MVGRLLEIDLPGGYRTVDDVEALNAKMLAVYAALPPGLRLVIIADWRTCNVLTPPVAQAAVAMMTSSNAHVERSAILHASEASTSVLQLARLIKESELENRRVFTDPSQLQLWLGEVLSEAENERLSAFLLGLGR